REPQLSRLCANDEPSRGLDLDPLEFSEGVSFDSDYSPEASTVDVYYWAPEKGSAFELRGEHDWFTSLYGRRWEYAESPGTFLASFALRCDLHLAHSWPILRCEPRRLDRT